MRDKENTPYKYFVYLLMCMHYAWHIIQFTFTIQNQWRQPTNWHIHSNDFILPPSKCRLYVYIRYAIINICRVPGSHFIFNYAKAHTRYASMGDSFANTHFKRCWPFFTHFFYFVSCVFQVEILILDSVEMTKHISTIWSNELFMCVHVR